MQNVKAGTILRFNNDPECRFKVVSVRNYSSFVELLDNEDIDRIDPTRNYDEQLQKLRSIFLAHKEKIGPVVFDMEKI
jgi:ASC-1-like (ASCH) protein